MHMIKWNLHSSLTDWQYPQQKNSANTYSEELQYSSDPSVDCDSYPRTLDDNSHILSNNSTCLSIQAIL